MSHTSYSNPWDKGKPVSARLPRDGYQNNPNVLALMSQPDYFLTSVKSIAEGFYAKLDPSVCPTDWLDYLGWLNGWSDEYWDTLWSSPVKRGLIAASNKVWSGLGQLSTLRFILDTHTIQYRIWASTSLQLSFSLPATFSTPKGVIYLRMPLKYIRGSRSFREAERTRQNFLPCTVLSATVYEYFYLGYSQMGEPLFNSGT